MFRRLVLGVLPILFLLTAGLPFLAQEEGGTVIWKDTPEGRKAYEPRYLDVKDFPDDGYHEEVLRRKAMLRRLERFGKMTRIPAGEFTMGSRNGNDNEEPVHQVQLDAFFIDVHEVTVERYAKCVDAGKCDAPLTGYYYNWGKGGRGNHPVNGVDWEDAKNFCSYAGKRLPTEAEWERAATWKDGNKYKYPSGKDSVSESDAVFDIYSTSLVGSKLEEINGTYDMAGNLWEWVHDRYGDYPSGKQTNPKGPASGSSRVIRGGGWHINDASYLRGAIRRGFVPASREYFLGFRCVVSSAAGL